MKQLKTTMYLFLKKLFSHDGEVSSKRVVGFGAFLLIVEAVQFELFMTRTMAEHIFYGLILLVGTCFGLNTLIDIKKKNSDSDLPE